MRFTNEVFAPFSSAVAGIATHLQANKVDFAQVTGETPLAQRNKIFNKFQDTNALKVIVAHPGCMSHGLTLTAADTIIWFSPITSLEIFEQANARIRRIGQHKKQQVLMLEGTPVEHLTYERLRNRRDVQDTVLDLLSLLTE